MFFFQMEKNIFMEKNKDSKGKINIELDEKVADGTYSNLAIINHSPSEFVVDFIQMMPGVAKAKVRSRVILTPQHAKRLMKALSDNVNKFLITLSLFVILHELYFSTNLNIIIIIITILNIIYIILRFNLI